MAFWPLTKFILTIIKFRLPIENGSSRKKLSRHRMATSPKKVEALKPSAATTWKTRKNVDERCGVVIKFKKSSNVAKLYWYKSLKKSAVIKAQR